MRTLAYLFGLSALFHGLGSAIPAPGPEPTIMPAIKVRDPGCVPTVSQKVDFKFDWEDYGPYCFRGPCGFSRWNFTSPKGQGTAYTKYGVNEKPLMVGNIYGWQIINCTSTDLAGKDESYACTNNTIKALYSPGKSPYDSSLKPRLGSLDFPRDYMTWAVKSFYITPVGLPSGAKDVTLELKGIKEDGSQVKESIKLQNTQKKKQFLIDQLDRKGFTQIKVLEFWLVVGGKGGYAFAIDDLVGTEYRENALPASCKPTTTTIDNGPCTPSPTKTTSWTENAEEFTTSTVLPTPYHGLNFLSYVYALNNTQLSTFVFQPAPIPSKGNNFYHSYEPFEVSANTYETRFGVKSLSIACAFLPWADPDYSGTNGAPCRITFVGRRDPFDGDGLPSRVVATYTIPNPGNGTATQSFTNIDLNKLTDAPGKFSRLYQFTIHTELGTSNYPTSIVIDNLVFTRTLPADNPKCRMPGGNTLNFDEISVKSPPAPLPDDYNGFHIQPSWVVISKNTYKKGEPGYIAPVSPNNALWNSGPSSYLGDIESYFSPVKNSLWSFESMTVTLDLPEYATNKDVLKDVTFYLSVSDACGGSTVMIGADLIDRQSNFYSRQFNPDKLQFTYAVPIVGITKMSISAWSTSKGEVKVFIDDLKYRKYTTTLPGCQRCGYRGADYCEVPKLTGR